MSEKRAPVFFVLEPSTGYTKYEHPSYESARLEARRLAYANPGREFLVLAAQYFCRYAGIDDGEYGDDIPF